MNPLDIVFFCFFALIASALVARAVRPLERADQSLIWAAFFAHVFATLAHVLVTEFYFGGGDSMGYAEAGAAIADLVRYDPSAFLPPMLQILFQVGQPELPYQVIGIGGSTGSMHSVGAVLALLTGNGIYASSLLVSLGVFLSSVLVYFSFKPYFETQAHLRLGIAVLLIPTPVFWNSGILKEPLAVMGLGFAIYGFTRYLQGRLGPATVLMGSGFLLIGLFKPYILFPTVVGLGFWYVSRRASRGQTAAPLRPIYFFIAGALMLVALVVLGQFFPTFAIDRFAESAARQQEMGTLVEGGSSYSMGNASQQTLLGQLMFAPLALFTALFRPFLFEARNGAAFINAIETTIFTLLAARVLLATSWSWVWNTIATNPVLLYCMSFVVVMATAVGLSTSNFGTLSRYRCPFVPFLGILVLTLSAKAKVKVETEHEAFTQRLRNRSRNAPVAAVKR